MNRVETTKSLAAASRGAVWLKALDPEAKLLGELIPSVAAADGEIDGRAVRFMAVLPDPKNRYPRARKGEVGLLEGWAVATSVLDFVQAASSQEEKTPLVLVIDVASQAYGRREEAFGIHQALAASSAAFIKAREVGHPVVGFIVGRISCFWLPSRLPDCTQRSGGYGSCDEQGISCPHHAKNR